MARAREPTIFMIDCVSAACRATYVMHVTYVSYTAPLSVSGLYDRTWCRHKIALNQIALSCLHARQLLLPGYTHFGLMLVCLMFVLHTHILPTPCLSRDRIGRSLAQRINVKWIVGPFVGRLVCCTLSWMVVFLCAVKRTPHNGE